MLTFPYHPYHTQTWRWSKGSTSQAYHLPFPHLDFLSVVLFYEFFTALKGFLFDRSPHLNILATPLLALNMQNASLEPRFDHSEGGIAYLTNLTYPILGFGGAGGR